RYAFPKTMAQLEPQHPRLVTLHDRVMARPRIAAYLSSPRRLAFNEQGIFRHYPELEEGWMQEGNSGPRAVSGAATDRPVPKPSFWVWNTASVQTV
ncbi:MAG TPA: glutathione S-transferase family protein, partial [Verrucomicrobiae bacterium]|nr:glutathione S-transferase family protein [Verrucomicrobiae bacterium]